MDAGNPATPWFPGTTRTDGFPDVGIIDMGYHYLCPYNVAQLDIKVMLQGPFAGTGMQTNLNNFHYLPLAQPFQGTPWNYNGTEAVTAIPNTNIVDWVLLELRQAPGASQALPGTMLCRQACFVNNTGKITGLDGDANKPVNLNIPQILSPGNDLFIIVWHRNHLGVLSAEPMQQNGPLFSYDFSTGAIKAYGGVNGHIEVGQGIWGMVSGDGDANGQVNNGDKVDVWKPQGGFSGYRAGDFNLDGQVNNQDKIDRWTPNGGRSCQVAFTMPGSLPAVITSSVSNVNCCNATFAGEVTSQGSYPVNERGFCWGTSPFPSLYDNHSNNGSGTGSFTEIVSGLNPSTTFYVRAYATNLLGTSYGSQKTFTTLSPLPVVTTSSVSNIIDTLAMGGGNITDEGTHPVTARGVCWSASQNPTLCDTHTVDGSGPGMFVSQLTGLSPLTTYYVRAYATSMVGTAYGNQASFTTLSSLPTVITSPVTNISLSTATGGGEVIYQGSHPVTARGVCWSTSQNPTLNDLHTIDGSGAGVFVSQLTGLNPTTLYYVRAYATNQEGTAYGNQVDFTTLAVSCPGIPTVTYEGQVYNTVQIGNQCWLRENLNVGTMINGSQNQANNGVKEKYCFNNDPANCAIYGGLYQWNEMMQYSTQQGVQGICPSGWHIPTDAEWTALTTYLGGQNVAGGKMKEAGTTHWLPPNTGATNESGFTALPGGCRFINGSFDFLTSYAFFWSSSESGTNAWYRDLSYDYAAINLSYYYKASGFSTRCLKD